MGIDWERLGQELKKRRERAGMTQDRLAAQAGVRLATIGRLEIGKIRPSLEMLEKLAGALNCRVRDLLPEEEKTMATTTEREPSMKGAPSYFRAGIVEAATRKIIGHDAHTGAAVRADYSEPAWHLAIHVEEYLSDEATEELEPIFTIEDAGAFEEAFWAFLTREFPGCVALVPAKRREQFLKGFYRAMEDGRFPFSR
jgi:transcriptional regulator with XRE-family HTH domain